MEDKMTRRSVIAAAASAGLAGVALAQQPAPKPPALSADLVKQFVIAGHANLPKVKELLEATPGLLNACWDWGGGDFETALEGAGHMGNHEIATYLISKGARANIFQVTMLGQLEVVKALIQANPDSKSSKGPHGISLMRHATAGGDVAAPVAEYLKGLGLS